MSCYLGLSNFIDLFEIPTIKKNELKILPMGEQKSATSRYFI